MTNIDSNIIGTLINCNFDDNETVDMWLKDYIKSEDMERLLKIPKRERFYEAVRIKAELY